MLIEPNKKYINYIENSKHYLNDPKYMLNHDLDCLYRQGIVFSKEKAIEYVENYLKFYQINSNATKWVEWRDSIDIVKFNKLNKNTYIDKMPKHIYKKHKHICDWTDRNTTYKYGYPNVPSYPHKNK